MEHPIIVLTGCTASGKSSMALELAKHYRWPIINADSKQVYKTLSIGTDTPIPEKIISDRHWVISGVDHYLYGYVNLNEDFNVSSYQIDVRDLLRKINTPVLLVGGTGLYIDAVTLDFEFPMNKGKSEDLSDRSIEELQHMLGDRLIELNPSDRMNPRRLIRSIQSVGSRTSKKQPLDHLYLVLDTDKEVLERNLSRRVEEMFNGGLPDEAESVRDLICSEKGINIIGYQEFREYFRGTNSLTEVKENILVHTRQYAKRQRTWFRRRKDAILIRDIGEARYHIENFLSDL